MYDKFHWYDGRFYDRFIAPNLDETFRIMMAMMDKNSSILDVGCGTGRFVFQAGKRVQQATGFDLSSRNISVAKSNQKIIGLDNVSFVHGNAESLGTYFTTRFQFSTISHVIHEMPKEIRLGVLNNMRKISDEIIIGDYFVPQPNNVRGISNRIAEFFAGFDHFRNYLSFVKAGGLSALIKEANMTILQEKIGTHGTSHILRIR